MVELDERACRWCAREWCKRRCVVQWFRGRRGGVEVREECVRVVVGEEEGGMRLESPSTHYSCLLRSCKVFSAGEGLRRSS